MAATDTLPPASGLERIRTIDIVRGVAVLGILLLNILEMGLPQAYFVPAYSGGTSTTDLTTWFIVQVLAEGKMRAIFSMLFGAAVILMTVRAEARAAGSAVADIWLRRCLWLMLFGLLHAYLLWEGDVLFFYGAVGLGLYAFRTLRPRTLILIGVLVLAIGIPRNAVQAIGVQQMRDAATAADRAAATGAKLTDAQKEAQKRWRERLKELQPSREQLQEAVNKHTGGWLNSLRHRASSVFSWQTTGFLAFILWDVWGTMLIGMALMKLGFFTGALADAVYVKTMVAGYALGLAINGGLAALRMAWWFDPVLEAWHGVAYDLCRFSMAIPHVALIVLLAKRGWLKPLAPVGQMALTNYILASLLGTIIFEGFGFGLYGRLERHRLYYVVAGIWAVQLVLSPWWLARFRFGPLEWLWRSLVRWQRQPMRREEPAGVMAAAGS